MRLHPCTVLRLKKMQLSFLPQILPTKHDYIVRRLNKNHNYDPRDDKKIKDSDVVGFCRLCGQPITEGDVRCVNALTYTQCGPNANGPIDEQYECYYIGCRK